MRTLVLLFTLTISCLAQPLSPNDPAFLQSTSPLRRGLVGYWRLEEASGTRYDCSQYGNHLTDNNSVGQGVGVQSECSTFVKTSAQFLSIPSTASLAMGDIGFTVCAWVNFSVTNAPGDGSAICGKWDGEGKYEYLMDLTTLGSGPYKGDFLVTEDGHVATYARATATTFGGLAYNVWYFIVGWHDPTANILGISVNGITNLVSYSTGVCASNSDFLIGRNGSNITSDFTGKIDEVGVWKRVLTPAEQTQLYNAGLGTHFPWAHP